MDTDLSALETTLDVFGRRLPVRALHHLVERGTVNRDELTARGISDRTIGKRLSALGVDAREIVRQRIASLPDVPDAEDGEDLFEFADESFRGDGNPLLDGVMDVVAETVSQR